MKGEFRLGQQPVVARDLDLRYPSRLRRAAAPPLLTAHAPRRQNMLVRADISGKRRKPLEENRNDLYYFTLGLIDLVLLTIIRFFL